MDRLVGVPPMTTTDEAARTGRLERVDQAVKDLRIGYFGQRNVKVMSVRQQAMCLLRALYTEIEKKG